MPRRSNVRTDDDAVLFRAERPGPYYWGPFALASLAMIPLALLDPVIVIAGLAVAAAVCAWNQSCFVFDLRPSHIALRGAPLDPVYRIAWDLVHEAKPGRVRQAWLPGHCASGTVSVVLRDDTCTHIPGVRDPAAASAAINAILSQRKPRGRGKDGISVAARVEMADNFDATQMSRLDAISRLHSDSETR